MNLIVTAFVLIIIMLLYLKLARQFGIVDRPNHRSSHHLTTIRGGGILIPFAVLIWFFLSETNQTALLATALLISMASFWDDIKNLSSGIRLLIHIISVSLVLYSFGLLEQYPVISILVGLAFIGWINMFNFMDGINGITAGYGLVTMATLWYMNQNILAFTDSHLIQSLVIALLIFSFFNFRKKAVCFAGDVGSVSLAFILGNLMIQLIQTSGNWYYILFFLIYVIDAGLTIIERLIKGHNILKPHRLHLYQLYANEKSVDHRVISLVYACAQLIINLIVLISSKHQSSFATSLMALLIASLLSIIYLYLKIKVFAVFSSTK